jgi:hypothetical protein
MSIAGTSGDAHPLVLDASSLTADPSRVARGAANVSPVHWGTGMGIRKGRPEIHGANGASRLHDLN